MCEFLHYFNFTRSLKCLEAEVKVRQLALSETPAAAATDVAAIGDSTGDLLRAFDRRDRQTFRALWAARLPEEVRGAFDMRRTYFHVEVLFFTSALLHEAPPSQLLARAALQEYLSGVGMEWTTDRDLLPLFSLPLLPRPQDVPAFAAVFSPEWAGRLRADLDATLAVALKKAPVPRIFDALSRLNAPLEVATRQAEVEVPGKTGASLAMAQQALRLCRDVFQLLAGAAGHQGALAVAPTQLLPLHREYRMLSAALLEEGSGGVGVELTPATGPVPRVIDDVRQLGKWRRVRAVLTGASGLTPQLKALKALLMLFDSNADRDTWLAALEAAGGQGSPGPLAGRGASRRLSSTIVKGGGARVASADVSRPRWSRDEDTGSWAAADALHRSEVALLLASGDVFDVRPPGLAALPAVAVVCPPDASRGTNPTPASLSSVVATSPSRAAPPPAAVAGVAPATTGGSPILRSVEVAEDDRRPSRRRLLLPAAVEDGEGRRMSACLTLRALAELSAVPAGRAYLVGLTEWGAADRAVFEVPTPAAALVVWRVVRGHVAGLRAIGAAKPVGLAVTHTSTAPRPSPEDVLWACVCLQRLCSVPCVADALLAAGAVCDLALLLVRTLSAEVPSEWHGARTERAAADVCLRFGGSLLAGLVHRLVSARPDWLPACLGSGASADAGGGPPPLTSSVAVVDVLVKALRSTLTGFSAVPEDGGGDGGSSGGFDRASGASGVCREAGPDDDIAVLSRDPADEARVFSVGVGAGLECRLHVLECVRALCTSPPGLTAVLDPRRYAIGRLAPVAGSAKGDVTPERTVFETRLATVLATLVSAEEGGALPAAGSALRDDRDDGIGSGVGISCADLAAGRSR